VEHSRRKDLIGSHLLSAALAAAFPDISCTLTCWENAITYA
jgi:hypothetical protein